ncbi:MAG: hypothetical protein F6K24_20355 [Okeania sp. SIO2D1]|nr:hypothetical protein [Okeania sp. SIO2D1]
MAQVLAARVELPGRPRIKLEAAPAAPLARMKKSTEKIFFLILKWDEELTKSEVRSDFCQGDLSKYPKIFRQSRRDFRPNYFDKN